MRSIVTISVSPAEKKKLVRKAKRAGTTITSYILHAVHVTEQLISEDELLGMSRRTEKEYRAGKTKRLGSLSDLIK